MDATLLAQKRQTQVAHLPYTPEMCETSFQGQRIRGHGQPGLTRRCRPQPAFTCDINGYVNNDPSTFVSGSTVITTTAVRTSPAWSYPTTVAIGTLASANYPFMLIGSTLAITGDAPQSIIFAPPPNFASGGIYQLSARTTSGLLATYTVCGPASVSGASLTVQGPGVVTVTTLNPGDANYAASASASQSFIAQ